MASSLALAAAAFLLLHLATALTTPTPHGVTISPPINAASADLPTLTIEVASATTFRLGVRFGGWANTALTSPTLDPLRVPASYTIVSWGGMTGIKTSFGALLTSTDGSGLWALYDANNVTLVAAGAAPHLSNASSALDAGVVLPVNGTAAALGPGRPCLGNGMFAPPYYYNRDASYLSFAVSSWAYDPIAANHHCYPVAFDGHVGATQPRPSIDYCDPAMRKNDTDGENIMRSAKYPDGMNGTTYAQCCAACNGAPDCTALIWSDGTHPDPNGNCWPLASAGGTKAGAGRVFAGSTPPPPPPPQQAWWAMGGAADWYLAPAASPLAYTRALYDLTGAPAIPPLYAWGFMVTYWGYEKMEFVEGNVTAFRDGQFPLDLTIMDYDCE